MKQIDPDGTFLEKFGVAGEAIFHHVGKELLRSRAVAEGVAIDDSPQLLEYRGAWILVWRKRLYPGWLRVLTLHLPPL
jgi:hypothetical protein